MLCMLSSSGYFCGPPGVPFMPGGPAAGSHAAAAGGNARQPQATNILPVAIGCAVIP